VSAEATAAAVIATRRIVDYPSLVIELPRDLADAAVMPVDWFDRLPDVVVLESRVDVDVHTLDDGRVIHVYRTTDPESGA
jgi:hypothetical protein